MRHHCSGNERFLVEDDSVFLLFDAGELFVVEYGSNEIIGTCRTEFISKHSVSYRCGHHAGIVNATRI